ncbi:MAG TPA: hypothetical protein VK806_13345 [Bacteroidia bacterium]|nr:hypothetical protein [Bacteroidia bacterium]
MRIVKIIFFLLFLTTLASAQTYSTKPDYVGHIEYTKGNFGTYNYPMKGDSILVFLKDSTINFIIFPKESNNPRTLEISSTDLQQVSRQMYNNAISTDEMVPTGSYDMKFADKNANPYLGYTLYITHFGDGSTADMTLLGENKKTRLNDLFVAALVKFK